MVGGANMINGIVINRSQLSKRPVGCILGSDSCNRFKNIVISYINGQNPILICTNLNQEQWDLFCDGKLSKKELDKYI